LQTIIKTGTGDLLRYLLGEMSMRIGFGKLFILLSASIVLCVAFTQCQYVKKAMDELNYSIKSSSSKGEETPKSSNAEILTSSSSETLISSSSETTKKRKEAK
jgi:hypothetical protein